MAGSSRDFREREYSELLDFPRDMQLFHFGKPLVADISGRKLAYRLSNWLYTLRLRFACKRTPFSLAPFFWRGKENATNFFLREKKKNKRKREKTMRERAGSGRYPVSVT